MLTKLALSRSIPKQIDQGKKVVTMSAKVLTGAETEIGALKACNADMDTKQAACLETRQAAAQATANMKLSSQAQRVAYANLGGVVNLQADGNPAFVLDTGYPVRATPSPVPPITEPPTDITTSINGVPGRVGLTWTGVVGALVYEAQSTTDLTGATGWKSVEETPAKSRINVDDLTSGTKYAFRVRALGNGQPGPWSGPVQQMAP